jgi:hypothetical protein
VVFLFKCPTLFLVTGISSREAKHVDPLAAPQFLQQNLLAVFETHGVAILIGVGTQLYERYF